MLYEDQATDFDERAGIPPKAAEAVARELAPLVGLNGGETLLEIGAGTGVLSIPIMRGPIRYIGFDRSPAMIAVFSEKLRHAGLDRADQASGRPAPELLVADGEGTWPAADGSADLIFSARAVHHIDAAHVAAEVRRVLRPEGGWLVLGRIFRPKDSVKSVLRRRMRRLLEERGFIGHSHDRHADEVFSILEEHGGRRLPVHVAAEWSVPRTPNFAINAWEGKDGFWGLDLPADVKADVLASLRAWASEQFGDLDAPLEQKEFFELASINLPAA